MADTSKPTARNKGNEATIKRTTKPALESIADDQPVPSPDYRSEGQQPAEDHVPTPAVNSDQG